MGKSKIIFGNEVLMDLTKDTVAADKLLSGYTAHGADGEEITGTCTFDADTSDADAKAGEILKDKTAYVNGVKITGDMPNNGAIDAKISTKDPYTVPIGYHDGSGTVSLDDTEADKIIPGNIKEGIEILGVTGTYAGEGVTAQSKSVVPYVDKAQTILPDENYDYLSQVTVAKIAYSEMPNTSGGITVTIGTMSPTA